MSRQISPDLSEAELLRMAQRYLSRRAASMLQLRQALSRKLARRFASNDDQPERAAVDAVLERVLDRIARSGLIDEPALARSRTDALVRQGLAAGVIRRRLAHQGLDPDAEPVAAVLPADDEPQARRFAQRKRLGGWRSGRREADLDRDIRSMVRAGFSPGLARRVLQENPESGPDEP